MMVKSLSVMLIFVIYCLLNIYEGVLMNASPMAAQCQHVCKCFALSIHLYFSTAYKNSFCWSILMKVASLFWWCQVYGSNKWVWYDPHWRWYHYTNGRVFKPVSSYLCKQILQSIITTTKKLLKISKQCNFWHT